MSGPVNLFGLPLSRAVTALGGGTGTAGHLPRITRALYREAGRGPVELAALAGRVSGLPRALVGRLAEAFVLEEPRLVARQDSAVDEGTVKLLFEAADGVRFESVLFRNRRRDTCRSLCLSTQAGCRIGCPFCATGRGRFERHLTAAEMVAQYLQANRLVAATERISNVVAMGMGEPLDNLDAVLDAISVFTDPAGVGLSAPRLVLSTAGHVPGLRRLAALALPIGLAVSLHAADDELRDRLVPLNRRYPLADLMETLRLYPLRPGKWICFEYVLLSGVNDSPRHAAMLGPLLAGLRALVQVIAFNEVPGVPFSAPVTAQVRAFAEQVRAKGMPVAVRASRGPDIAAACGQLRAHAGR
ncbi:MAG: 23S rRNA (adenine(2503)-C(2))-methyltransferase RlmN [Candidatus Riflebacteria bacterium]|nr:23S rRNA (adenine(2503)-C(2))-methyltransferase RlmN [Candidatus Riflebacteria bacterium]